MNRTTVPRRNFLSRADAELVVDQLGGVTPPPLAVHVDDQIRAATRDTETLFTQVSALTGMRDRLADAHRARVLWVRLMNTVLSARPTLCPHVDQDGAVARRPFVIAADPPLAACHACLRSLLASAGPPHWSHECDACGANCEQMVPVALSAGPIYLNAHVCAECAAAT